MPHRPCSWPRCPNTTRRGSGRCHVHRYADRDARDQEPPPRALAERDEAVDALRANFTRDLRIDATVFVSGAYSIDVSWGGDLLVVQYFPPDEWRVSAGLDEDEPDHVLTGLGDVIEFLRNRRPPPRSH